MQSEEPTQAASEPAPADAPPQRPISPAAQRALAEAAERRRLAEAAKASAPTEINGRGGLDPSRFGDWEIDGRAVDF